MRPCIKQLIELIEIENWRQVEDQIRDNGVGISQFRPHESEFPRVCYYGAQIDAETYEPFTDDEKELIAGVFRRRRRDNEEKHEQVVASKLRAFLTNRHKS